MSRADHRDEGASPHGELFQRFLNQAQTELPAKPHSEIETELLIEKNTNRPAELAVSELTVGDDIRAFFEQFSTFLGSGISQAGKQRAMDIIISKLAAAPEPQFQKWTEAIPELGKNKE